MDVVQAASLHYSSNHQRAMFTSNVKFFQKAIVLHPEDERFLVLKRRPTDTSAAGQWDLPGGGVDFGELHLPALEREIWEETGLHILAPSVVEMITRFDPTQEVYSIFVAHQCRATDNHVRLSDEHSSYRWVTPLDWVEFDAPPALKQVVRTYEMRQAV
jgi:8-oxo-dGTP diphosphatase